jgi:hypothetical protein
MAPTDVLRLRPVAEDCMADCLALSAEAGWNQTAEDWALFMRYGTVFGFPGRDRQLAATGAILPYPSGFAWISMVLVTASRRRERIGTGILGACCNELTQRGLVSILDATPAGERVYRPLGFEPMFNLSRWQGVAVNRSSLSGGIRAMTADDLAKVTAMDAAAFGAPRKFLIESLFRRAPQLAFVAQDGTAGFVLARPGRVATQIGPVVAVGEDTGEALLTAALGSAAGPVFLDLADRWVKLARYLQQRSFVVQRPFLRMGLNRSLAFGDPECLFVVAGPEFG